MLAHPPSSPKSSGHSCVLAVGLFCVYFARYLKTILEWLNVHKPDVKEHLMEYGTRIPVPIS